MITKRYRLKHKFGPSEAWIEVDETNTVVHSSQMAWAYQGIKLSAFHNWNIKEVPLLVPKEVTV
jgi:hypothetical protein